MPPPCATTPEIGGSPDLAYQTYGRVSSRFGGRTGEGLKAINKSPELDRNRPKLAPGDGQLLVVFIEHCTARRPSESLKGSSEKYVRLAEEVEAEVGRVLEAWALDVVRNPKAGAAPCAFVNPADAPDYCGRVGDAQQSYFVQELPKSVLESLRRGHTVIDEAGYPARLTTYPRIGSFEVLFRVLEDGEVVEEGRVYSKLETRCWPSAKELVASLDEAAQLFLHHLQVRLSPT